MPQNNQQISSPLSAKPLSARRQQRVFPAVLELLFQGSPAASPFWMTSCSVGLVNSVKPPVTFLFLLLPSTSLLRFEPVWHRAE